MAAAASLDGVVPALQAEPGDFAFFMRKEAIEITYDGDDYLIVPHGAILALVRPDADDGIDPVDQILGSL